MTSIILRRLRRQTLNEIDLQSDGTVVRLECPVKTQKCKMRLINIEPQYKDYRAYSTGHILRVQTYARFWRHCAVNWPVGF